MNILGGRTFIIAEAGINHNGNIKLAKILIDAAKGAGADAVKFQTFWNLGKLKYLELTKEEFIELKRYSDSKDIIFLSTPHTIEAIDFLDKLVPVYKVASPFLTDYKFLKHVASKHKPIFLSTGSLIHDDGMATIEEIKQALNVLSFSDVVLMHCVSRYPCFNNHNERIMELEKLNKIVGLSDHTKELNLPYVPVIEKHLMLREYPYCIDYNVSIYPDEFKKMVQFTRSKDKK